ncbi:hypothetical protein THAOC_37641, partial [Thalassiosira oceanica]
MTSKLWTFSIANTASLLSSTYDRTMTQIASFLGIPAKAVLDVPTNGLINQGLVLKVGAVPIVKTEDELNGSSEEKKKAKASRETKQTERDANAVEKQLWEQGVQDREYQSAALARSANDDGLEDGHDEPAWMEQVRGGDVSSEENDPGLIQLVRSIHGERKTSPAMYLDAVDRGIDKLHDSGLLVVHKDHVQEALAMKKLAWADSADLTDEEKAKGFSAASHVEVEAAITAASVTTRTALGLAMVDRYGQCRAYKDNLHNNNREMPPTLALLATAIANHTRLEDDDAPLAPRAVAPSPQPQLPDRPAGGDDEEESWLTVEVDGDEDGGHLTE